MPAKTYEPEEIHIATGESTDSADPESSFFLGPTSESDLVYAFANKLEALVFLNSYFDNQLSKSEKIKIGAQIRNIRKHFSDDGTIPIPEIFESNDSLEIYASGYWEDFVTTSQPYWQEWLENSGDYVTGKEFWHDDDEMESMDEILDEEDAEDIHLLFSEAPEDVFNPEFIEALMKIIPMA